MSTTDELSDELLAAFIDGRCTARERVRVLHALGDDREAFEVFGVAAGAAALAEPEGRPMPVRYPALFRLCGTDSDATGVGDRCVICCEQSVLNRFGIATDLDELTAIAERQGWYVPGYGTAGQHVGRLSEHFGLKAVRHWGGCADDLVRALAHGVQVIACVDGGELTGDREAEAYEDAYIGERADHALVVAGVEGDGETDCRVVVCDPATPERYDCYPLDRFLDAWADGGFYMVAIMRREEQEE